MLQLRFFHFLKFYFWIKKLNFFIFKILCLDLKAFGSSFIQDEGVLSHGEAVLGNLSELGDTPEIDLGAILERYDNVTPLSNEARHDLYILDHIVAEVLVVLPRQVWDHGHTKVGEPVAHVHGAWYRNKGQGEPKEGEIGEEVRCEVAVLAPPTKNMVSLLI